MSNDCINLPEKWQKRTSSILTNECVVLYTKLDCKSDKDLQIFMSPRLKFYDTYFSKPDNIPNFSFYKTKYYYFFILFCNSHLLTESFLKFE